MFGSSVLQPRFDPQYQGEMRQFRTAQQEAAAGSVQARQKIEDIDSTVIASNDTAEFDRLKGERDQASTDENYNHAMFMFNAGEGTSRALSEGKKLNFLA